MAGFVSNSELAGKELAGGGDCGQQSLIMNLMFIGPCIILITEE